MYRICVISQINIRSPPCIITWQCCQFTGRNRTMSGRVRKNNSGNDDGFWCWAL